MHISLLSPTNLSAPSCPSALIQVGYGRDQTLFALVPGYVRFYQLPYDKYKPLLSPNMPNATPRYSNLLGGYVPLTRRPKGWRRYIGIVFNQNEELPRDEYKEGRSRLFFGKVDKGTEDTEWKWVEEGEGKGRFVKQEAGKGEETVVGGGAAQQGSESAVKEEAPIVERISEDRPSV
jgi:hypothetical protein